MILEMLDRWNDLGKPLIMIPKDFRDRILIGVGINAGGAGGTVISGTTAKEGAVGQMHKQVRLNYMKWLELGIDIDMFEMFCLLIIYSRSDLQ